MIEILICDDDKHFCGYMENSILDWAVKNQCHVNVEQCYSGRSLRRYMKREERPDLLFLDIELGDETGMDIGEYIREYLKDENLQIVYVSSHTQYTMKLFEIRPFHFLIKPVEEESLRWILSKYREIKLCPEKRYFIYRQKHTAHRIPLEDILYLQSDRKKIRIFTNRPLLREGCGLREEQEGCAEYYGNLEGAMEQLDCGQFWHIHKSYIVNTKYVKVFGRNKFILQDGKEIPVSRSRWKEVRQWILQYREV